jgi:hypothetical protein
LLSVCRAAPRIDPWSGAIRSRTITLSVVLSVVAILAVATVMSGWGASALFGEAGEPDPIADSAAPIGSDAGPITTEPPFALVLPADPGSITISDVSFSGWSVLDRRNNRTVGSANAETEWNTTESMIKPWIVADYLRGRYDESEEPTPEELDELALVIEDSNDPLAEKYYQLGGADELMERLTEICGLTNLIIEPTLWGNTLMTPADAVRYGACLADGRAAGPQWTRWLLDTMRQVRGSVDEQDSGEVQGGRWGIIDGLPEEVAENTSIKNGWTVYEDGWHVNCLAIHPTFVLSVMMRTYAELDEAAAGCASVAADLAVEHQP